MYANDTNIFVYSIDPTDVRKHTIAREILKAHARARFPVVLQSLQEFYFATTRKRLLSNTAATQVVLDALNISPIIETTQADIVEAMHLHDLHQLQFFDALLLTTAARAGCTTLLSEDMQPNRTYGTITVRNPFIIPQLDLDALLA
jgi:predicted nucleic acid-binding protein